jgi:hypothetical protein
MGTEEKTTKKPRKGRADNSANLKDLRNRTPEERSAIGRKGGIASGIAKREKILMSSIYAEFLEEEFDVPSDDGGTKKMSTKKMVNQVMKKVLSRCDSTSVTLLREIREGTEGSRQTVDLNVTEEATKEIQDIFGVEMEAYRKKDDK